MRMSRTMKMAALIFAAVCLFGISAIAFQTTGYRSRLYNQPAADGLASVTAAETLGFGMGFNGLTWDRHRIPATFKSVALGAGTTETTIWTPASGKKFRLMGLVLTSDVATTLTFKDDTAGSTILTVRLGAAMPLVITPDMLGKGILSATADNVLTVTRGTSATLDGMVVGQEN